MRPTIRRCRLLLLAMARSTMIGCGIPEPSPTGSVTPSSRLEVLSLTQPDTQMTIAAVDGDGPWGTITVRRGADTGRNKAILDRIMATLRFDP